MSSELIITDTLENTSMAFSFLFLNEIKVLIEE